MIEIAVAIAVLAIVGASTSALLATSTSSSERNREAALAYEAVQGMLDELQACPRAEVFSRYNATVADDPAAGDSPGNAFDVQGLAPIAIDPDGRVGLIEFPGNGVQLLETYVDRDLGCPRDLNGDGDMDLLPIDHSLDYVALPVRVTVTYRTGARGRTVSFVTML